MTFMYLILYYIKYHDIHVSYIILYYNIMLCYVILYYVYYIMYILYIYYVYYIYICILYICVCNYIEYHFREKERERLCVHTWWLYCLCVWLVPSTILNPPGHCQLGSASSESIQSLSLPLSHSIKVKGGKKNVFGEKKTPNWNPRTQIYALSIFLCLLCFLLKQRPVTSVFHCMGLGQDV